MEITLSLHWWYFPAALVLGAVLASWLGSRESGMFGGLGHAMLALALVFGAAVSAATFWILKAGG